MKMFLNVISGYILCVCRQKERVCLFITGQKDRESQIMAQTTTAKQNAIVDNLIRLAAKQKK